MSPPPGSPPRCVPALVLPSQPRLCSSPRHRRVGSLWSWARSAGAGSAGPGWAREAESAAREAVSPGLFWSQALPGRGGSARSQRAQAHAGPRLSPRRRRGGPISLGAAGARRPRELLQWGARALADLAGQHALPRHRAPRTGGGWAAGEPARPGAAREARPAGPSPPSALRPTPPGFGCTGAAGPGVPTATGGADPRRGPPGASARPAGRAGAFKAA